MRNTVLALRWLFGKWMGVTANTTLVDHNPYSHLNKFEFPTAMRTYYNVLSTAAVTEYLPASSAPHAKLN